MRGQAKVKHPLQFLVDSPLCTLAGTAQLSQIFPEERLPGGEKLTV